VIAPEHDKQMGFNQGLVNFTSAPPTRLNVINVLKGRGFVNAQKFNYRSNQGSVSVAIGHKDVCTLAGSHEKRFIPNIAE
jgi:hypothetical protein